MTTYRIGSSSWTGAGSLLCLCFLAGCSDPADKVPQSTTTAPQAANATVPAGGKTYAIAAGSKVGFVGSKVTGSHNGGFTNISGSITVDAGKIVGTPQIQIDMKSTWSDNPRLTGHLRSPDFFDVEKFPASTFAITSIAPGDDGKAKVTGNLTLHGVEKSISFPAGIEVAADAVTVKADFAINRKDFGIIYPGKPDDLIRDNVVINLDIRATP